MHDIDVLNAGVKSIFDFEKDDLVPHFIYCGYFYTGKGMKSKRFDRFKKILLKKMKSYGIQSATLTILNMMRFKLITKEKVAQLYEGKFKKSKGLKGSINDDLEAFFTKLQYTKKIKNKKVHSFLTPKLTDEEMKLVEERNELHIATYLNHYFGEQYDVDEEEMEKSESKSKYVYGGCWRDTIHLKHKKVVDTKMKICCCCCFICWWLLP